MKINKKQFMATTKMESGTSHLQKSDGLSVKDEVSLSSSKGEIPFYSKVDFGSGGSKSSQSQTFDNVLKALNRVKNDSYNVSNDMGWAEREIDDASRELRYSHSDINRVKRDNDKTDVSSTGYSLDRMVRSVDRDLRDADTRLGYADRNMDNIENLLSGAHKDLDNLGKELSASGGYEQVVGLIDKAKGEIASAFQHGGDADNKIYDTDGSVGDADREMNWAQFNVNRIKSDRPGTNVSSEGYQLDSKVSNAEWDLRDAGRDISSAKTGMGYLDSYTSQAINTVQRALNTYNSMAGISEVKSSTSSKADIETAKSFIEKAIKGLDSAKPGLALSEKEAMEAEEDLEKMPPHIKKIKLDFIGKDVSAEGTIMKGIAKDAVKDMAEGDKAAKLSDKTLQEVQKDIGASIESLKGAKDDKDAGQAMWSLNRAKDKIGLTLQYTGLLSNSFSLGEKEVGEMGDYLDIVEMDTDKTDVGRFADDLTKCKTDSQGNIIDARVTAKFCKEDLDDIKGSLEKALKYLK